jgi:3-isopropylmalate/(R)-2-methylmalate dehydratase large subunit
MAMTITEKILAAHAGKSSVCPGDLVSVQVDLALANDITGPLAIERFSETGFEKVFDPARVVFVADHFTPNKDIESANQCKKIREFAQRQGLLHYFEGGEAGVEHALLPEKGLIHPGDVVVGADSHTCTYGAFGAFATGVGSTDLAAVMATGELWLKVPETIRVVFNGTLPRWVEAKDMILHVIGDLGVDGARYCAVEFSGETVETLSVAGRMTIANMAVEMGAKNGIFEPSAAVKEYLRGRGSGTSGVFYFSDADASYRERRSYDVSRLSPQVALPFSPGNVRGIDTLGAAIRIDQAVIGSCTNGRIEDLRTAAQVLKGRRVAPGVRLLIIPATPECYRMALQEGLLEIFLAAGALICPPTCGPCLGGHMGILADAERAVATTNRNFPGRMGGRDSEVYLANPAVAAASAVAGYIASPDAL